MKRFCLPRFSVLLSLSLLAAAAPANLFAEANYVYHERTTANPGCGSGNYVTTLNPSSAQSYDLRFKVEFQFGTDRVRVYYTTNGSTPGGTFGTGNVGTFVVTASYVCTFGSPVVDVCSATIPALPAGTVVKYIVSAWHNGGGDEIFGNGCGNCGTENSSSALATVHQYTVGSTTDLYWDSNGTTAGAGATPTGTWGTSTFWSTVFDGTAATAAWTSGLNAVFSAGADATGTYTVTLGAAQTASGVTVEEGTVSLAGSALTVGTGTITVNNGAKLSIPSTTNLTASAGANLNLNGGAFRNTVNAAVVTFLTSNMTINVGSAGGTVETANTGTSSSIYTGSIKGTGNTLTKTGTGEFRYEGAGTASSTYSKLLVNQGLFRLGSVAGNNFETGFGAVPASFTSDAVTISNGAAIGTSFNISLNVNRGVTLGAGGGAFNTSAGTLTVPSVITGPGALVKNTSGTLTLVGANTFQGGVSFTGGEINFNHNDAAGTGAITITPAVAVTLRNSVTGIVITNDISLNTGASATLDMFSTSGQTLTLNGAISGSAIWTRGSGGGAGNLILGGINPNTFSGTLGISSGTLTAAKNDALGTIAGATTVNSGGALGFQGDINYTTLEPINIVGTGLSSAGAINNLSGNNSFAGPLTMTAASFIGAAAASSLTLHGAIGGSFALTKVGAGTIILNANNGYSATTVSAGTLLVNNITGSGTGAGAVAVNAGTLGGTGTISGVVSIGASGTLAPGTAIGTLTLLSSPVLGGTVAAEINKTGVTLTGDKLVVSGNPLAYAGALTVTTSGNTLAGGDTFDLFDASAFSGAFVSSNLPSLGAGLNWWLGKLTVDGTIAVNRAPTASAAIYSCAPGLSVGIQISGTGGLASDADADALTASVTSAPTKGSATVVTISGNRYIYYLNNGTTGADSFNYTVNDGRGGTATATVSINVETPPAQSQGTLGAPVVIGAGPAQRVKFLGIPAYNYALEWATVITGPWTALATNPASGTGLATFTNNTPDLNNNFYRTRWVP